jgi:hypothetical protein
MVNNGNKMRQGGARPHQNIKLLRVTCLSRHKSSTHDRTCKFDRHYCMEMKFIGTTSKADVASAPFSSSVAEPLA